MRSFVNGSQSDTIDIHNRSFAYGDGIFETCKIVDSQIILWEYHLLRLKKGLQVLQLNLDIQTLEKEIKSFLKNQKLAVLKIIISRKSSIRGYGFGDNLVDRILIIDDYSKTSKNIKLTFCESGYSKNPKLAGIKHQNRLEQILARQNNSDCIMMLKNNIISTTYANIFIIKNSQIFTPNLDNCGICGTRRSYLLDNLDIKIKDINKQELLRADEVFITNSLIGIQSITQIQDEIFNNILTNNIKQQFKL